MPIDPRREALRLIRELDQDFLADLAIDPITTIEIMFDINVTVRPPTPSAAGCDIDGTYTPGPPPRIFIADNTTMERRRFTALHELGHHLIEHDAHLNDLPGPIAARHDELICNEVAASILLPDELVDRHLQQGAFQARDVAALYAESRASRAACCVAAVRKLGRPGCVLLGDAAGVATFIAHQPGTPWRIARGTPQGADSPIRVAARSDTRHARGVYRARFANGTLSGELQADAFAADDGCVFAVYAMDTHSPWATGLNLATADTKPEGEEIECPHCDRLFTAWGAPCRRCGDYQCSRCGRCSCPLGPAQRLCQGSCGLMRPGNQFAPGSDVCDDCNPDL